MKFDHDQLKCIYESAKNSVLSHMTDENKEKVECLACRIGLSTAAGAAIAVVIAAINEIEVDAAAGTVVTAEAADGAVAATVEGIPVALAAEGVEGAIAAIAAIVGVPATVVVDVIMFYKAEVTAVKLVEDLCEKVGLCSK